MQLYKPKENYMALTQKNQGISNDGKKNLIMLVVGMTLLTALIVAAVLFFNKQNNSTKQNIEKIGRVVETAEQDGTTAWLVEQKNGARQVFYTAKGTNVVVTGDAFDAKTGDPIFTKLTSQTTPSVEATQTQETTAQAQGNSQSAEPQQADFTPGQAIGEWKGEVPKAIQILDKLKGFKEGDAGMENTVYIIYDPRCPYCHKLFERTRSLDLAKKGISLKWLPTVALGNGGIESPEMRRAAAGIVAKNAQEFAETLKDGNQGVKASENDVNTVSENLAFLYDASQQTFGTESSVAVPAVFFVDKRNGSPRMVYGGQEDKTFVSIFGE